jgi:thiamine kinase-like enzyme
MDTGSEMEELSGGRSGSIFKIGHTIVRPANRWTKNLHQFLRFVCDQEKNFVPEPISLGKDEEKLSFLPGEAIHYPIPKEFWNDKILKSAAQLLKKLHDFGAEYISKLNGTEIWLNKPILPVETMCHGDFAPYNVTFENNLPSGIIDFDSVHPGPRIRDRGYAIYRWVPLCSTKNPDSPFSYNEKIRRTAVFLSEYEVPYQERNRLIESMIQKLSDLVEYMEQEASNGDVKFQKDISEGHHLIYQEDIRYLIENKSNINIDLERIMENAI